MPDLDLREIAIAVPLVVLTIAMGVFPQPLILGWMGPSVDQMANTVMTAREVNVQRGATPPIGPPGPRVDAGSRTATQGRLLAEVPRSSAE